MSRRLLVVGGTGMLSGVVLHYAGLGDAVWVIARGKRRFEGVLQRSAGSGGVVRSLALDYHRTDELADRISMVQQETGPFDLVITWIHSTAPLAERTVRSSVAAAARRPTPCFRVLGSSHAAGPVGAAGPEKILDRTIRLGCVPDGAAFRWLTWEEIASGVIAAVDTDAQESVIGTWPLPKAARTVLWGEA